jgi:hypothetical protein
MTPLPVELAWRLAACPPERHWLIEGLWADQAVGIVGGEPKCCKSFLALDMAVAVSSGTPCLRRFPVARRGRVLLFAAEDALHVVRERLEGICGATGVRLADLDIHVITAPTVRLDLATDQQRLTETVSSLRPVLLVLDPFVRLHRIDENVSAEVAPLLAYLRDLQRRFALAVALVHHARKGAARLRDGQALRGSSEFHAWGDSNLYLRRRGEELALAVEHRAAPSRTGIRLGLHGASDALALAVLDETATDSMQAAPASPQDKIERVLAAATAPVSLAALRHSCQMRTSTLCETLAHLTKMGRVLKTPAGYRLAS